MNKRQIIASLNKIANELDNNGLYNEANKLTKVMSRLAYDDERDYMNDKMEYNTEDMGYCPDCGEWIGDNENCEDCGWGMDNDSFDDEMMDEDPNAWQYEDHDEDMLDKEHRQKNDFPHHVQVDYDDF